MPEFEMPKWIGNVVSSERSRPRMKKRRMTVHETEHHYDSRTTFSHITAHNAEEAKRKAARTIKVRES